MKTNRSLDCLKTRKVHTTHYTHGCNQNVNTSSADEQPYGAAPRPSLRQDVCHRAVQLTSIQFRNNTAGCAALALGDVETGR
jgi:hypothetical protein